MECLFNPTQLSEKLSVNYNRLPVLGLDHQVVQYQGTANRRLDAVEFYWDHFSALSRRGRPDILAFRTFIGELMVPAVGASAPPRVLFVWPGVLTIEAVVIDAEVQYRQVSADGTVLVYAAMVTFEEVMDVHRAAADAAEVEQ